MRSIDNTFILKYFMIVKNKSKIKGFRILIILLRVPEEFYLILILNKILKYLGNRKKQHQIYTTGSDQTSLNVCECSA